MMGTEGLKALMRLVASQPSITGRLISMRMSAGVSDSAMRTACSPSAAQTTE